MAAVPRTKPKTAARKRPRQARSRATVEAILEASSRILAERGLAETTTTAVAELAGVSVGTLYQYFPSKEALVAGVIEAHLERDRQRIAAAFERAHAAASLPAALLALAAEAHALYADRTALYREMIAAMDEVERARQIEDLVVECVDQTAALLEARSSEHDHPHPERAAWVLVRAAIGLLRMAAAGRPEWVEAGILGQELRLLGARYLGLN